MEESVAEAVSVQCPQPQLLPHPPPDTGGSPTLLLSFEVSNAAPPLITRRTGSPVFGSRSSGASLNDWRTSNRRGLGDRVS